MAYLIIDPTGQYPSHIMEFLARLDRGAVAVFAGLWITSLAGSLWVGIAAYALGVGIAVACAYVPMVAVVGGWFERQRTLALGVAVSGIGFGTLVLAGAGWLLSDSSPIGGMVSTDAELLDLGEQGVLVPDFVFHHPPSGVRVYMEVFGFWRKGAVESRLRLLRKHGPKNLILALSKQLATGQEGLDEVPGEVYVFRTTPLARQVLKLLEAYRPQKKGRAKKRKGRSKAS